MKRKWSLWQISPRRLAAPISNRRGELLVIVASLWGTPELTEMACMRNFDGFRVPRGIPLRIKNAANARGNDELAGEPYRQFQPACDAPNFSIRPDRFFSVCAARISG